MSGKVEMLSAEESRDFLEHALVPMCVANFAGQLVWVNRAFCSTLGYARAWLTGREFLDLVHPDERAPTRAEYERRMASDASCLQFRNRYRTASGDYRLLDWTGQVLREHGRVHCTALDVTELEEERIRREDSLRSLYEHIPVMLHSINADGRIEMVSDYWLSKMGYAREEVVGRRSTEFLTPQSQELAKQTLAQFFATGRCTNVPYQYITRAGDIREMLLSATAEWDADGNFLRSRAVSIDITDQKCAERELESQRTLLQSFFESVPDATVITDAQRCIVMVNRGVTTSFGYQPVELVGQPTRMLYADDNDYASRGQTHYHRNSLITAEHYQARYRRKDGAVFPAETVGSVIRAPSGALIGYLKLIRDISERVEREHALRITSERNAALLQAIPDLICRIRRDGSIIDYKQEMGWRLFPDSEPRPSQMRPEVSKIDELPVSDALKGLGRTHIQRAIDTGKLQSFKYDLQHAGKSVYYEVRVVKSSFDEAVCIVRDVTESEQAQQVLRERTSELERSNADLEQFAYVVSHDLQEPLRMVSSYMALLAEDYATVLDSEALEYIHFARSGSERMKDLVRAILQYSRVGRSQVSATAVDLGDVVTAVLCDMHAAIASAKAEIVVSPLPVVAGDAKLLAQVFQNLIGNALKFTEQVPRIRISAQRSAGSWQVSVADNGIGLAPNCHERVFDVFQRLHRDKYPGTGIGLAIVKRIVERHDGRVSIDSHPGQGCTFHLNFPALPDGDQHDGS